MITFNGGRKSPNGRQTGLASSFAAVIRGAVYGRPRNSRRTADRADRTSWTSTRNLLVEEPCQVAIWMRAWASQNARVKCPVYHFGISLAPEEHLSQVQWEHVLDRMLEHLGLAEHQAFVALRRDGGNERLRIVVNRVGPDGRAWKPSWDVLKQQAVARAMERELGLHRVPTRRDLRLLASHPLPGSGREKSFTRRVAMAALKDFRQATCWEDLEARLLPHGLRLEPYRAGVRVSDGRERIGLSRVDSSLSGPRLTDRFGETLDEFRDRCREARS